MKVSMTTAWLMLGESLLFTPLALAVRARRRGGGESVGTYGNLARRLLHGLWWTLIAGLVVPLFVVFFAVALQQHGMVLLVVLLVSFLLPLQVHILWHAITAFELAAKRDVAPSSLGIPRWYQRWVLSVISGQPATERSHANRA